MSLLKKATRIKYFKDLGLGDYNKDNILKMQKKYFRNPKEWDGRYGKKTDILLRHLHNVWKYTDDFKPTEFRCPCGKCTGYPTWMKANELKNAQAIRTHYGRPMVITSALRCKDYNYKVGGILRSKHLEGRAVDFFMKEVTDSLARRKVCINWSKGLKKFNYAYCNGWNSLGQVISKPSMGNAIHIDSKE